MEAGAGLGWSGRVCVGVVVPRGRSFATWVMPPLLSLLRAYKKIELEDLRFPLVCGEGKKVKP